MREIPPDFLTAGTIRIDLRRDIEEEIKKKKYKINEIRFREIGFQLRDNKKVSQRTKLKTTTYKAGNGKEYFLEIINKDNILFGLCRISISKKQNKAFIRELHVYGKSLAIGEKAKKQISQHKGLGKKLMQEAEKICKKQDINNLYVISGVGVRNYYHKLGYRLKNSYMHKKLN